MKKIAQVNIWVQQRLSHKRDKIRAKFQRLIDKNLHQPTQIKHQFYPRVINTGDVIFTQPEISLLNKGLKHNVYENKNKNNDVRTLLVMESAILSLPNEKLNLVRFVNNDKLQKAIDKDKCNYGGRETKYNNSEAL